MDSLAFLERPESLKRHSVYIVYGDEDFLRRQTIAALSERLLGEDADQFGASMYTGEETEFATVRDELHTLPFLSPVRLVIVENAEPFVTRFRSLLEKYLSEPSSRGVLVLSVRAWPSNTRLAKMLAATATIECKTPTTHRLSEWCGRWAKQRYSCAIGPATAHLLVDAVGPDMGQLDQELAKLAGYVGNKAVITADDVNRLAGRSKEENTFKLFDAIADDEPGHAIALLDQLLDQGEDPLRILGACSLQLRRLAQAARLRDGGVPLGQAWERLGVPPFARRSAEHQLHRLGRGALGQVFSWLLDVDVGLKGASPLAPRVLLERLIIRLSAGVRDH